MKTALITGGSGGIGSAICKALADMGYAAAVGYHSNEQAAQEVCKSISESGGVALAVKCSVDDPKSIQAAFELISRELSAPEALINCAGTANIGLFTDLSDDEVFKLVNENLTGAMLMSKAAVPEMVRRHKGYIVNISSVWGEVGASCEVVYSAAKAGLIGFTKALAREVAPSGINVNCISAGLIDTKMNAELSADDMRELIQDIPAGRIGTPDDIANAVRFLLSGQADYINGQTIRIDGSWT